MMRRSGDNRGRWKTPLIGALLVLCLAVSPLRVVAQELLPIRIGITHAIEAGPLYIAVANGYFRDEGLDAQLKFFASDALVPAAAARGQVDIGAASLSASFFGYAAAHGLTLIAAEVSDQADYPGNALLLISKKAYDAGFRGVNDLPHKRIGLTSAGSGVRYSLVRIAARYHLDPHDLEFRWLGTQKRQLAALARGEIDAAAVPYVAALKIVAADKGAALLSLSNLNEWQQGVFFARRPTGQADRSLVEKFLRAYRRGAAEYDLNFQQRDDDEGDLVPGPHYQDYLALIARQAKLPPEFVQLATPYCDHLARLDVADIESQLKFWQGMGMVEKGIAASDLLDLSLIGEHIGALSAPM